MSKHTPGPWLWTKSSTGGFAMQGDLNGQAVEIVFRTEDMRQADAHLISAAPELLEALQHLMLYDFGDSEGAIKARAAIAKAEGRA